MNHRFVLLPRIIATGLVLATGSLAHAEEKLPNIIIVYADDLGYGDLSCYNPEAKYTTPRLDQMAAEGIRFTDAHSPSTICSPSRYGLFSGQQIYRSTGRGGGALEGPSGPSTTLWLDESYSPGDPINATLTFPNTDFDVMGIDAEGGPFVWTITQTRETITLELQRSAEYLANIERLERRLARLERRLARLERRVRSAKFRGKSGKARTLRKKVRRLKRLLATL